MNKKRVVSVACLICGVPLLLALGVWLIGTERYAAVSTGVALLSCVPVAVTFEKGKKSGRELAVLAVLTALTVVGRVIFAPVPGFKPVTAMTVIAGVAFGAEAGFMTGSMSALISNIYFGQGPWTPFQMAAWGFIGLLAGLLFSRRRNPPMMLLLIYGAFAGVAF